jgi:protein gp37
MGETTGISWTDSTFNPWVGCTKLAHPAGSACDHCYAVAFGRRLGVAWGGNRKRTRPENWRRLRQWNADGPRFRRERGHRRRVFVASLADWLDNQVPLEWCLDLCAEIDECTNLDFLMLTKRPQNYRKRTPRHWHDFTPRNVWLGVTVEDELRYRMRFPYIARIPAVVRFLSFEPGLGALGRLDIGAGAIPDWIITGGLSGVAAPHATIFPPAAVRSARDACVASGVAFFHKQWGHYGNNPLVLEQGLSIAETRAIDPDKADQARGVPENGKGGALLDGRLWREFPARE